MKAVEEAAPTLPDAAWDVDHCSCGVDPPSGFVTVQPPPTSNHDPVGVVVNGTEVDEPKSVDWKVGAVGVPPPVTV